MTYYTFGTQRLFRSLDKAAQYAVDGDIKADRLCVLVDGRHVKASRHDVADLEMYMREYQVF